MFSAADDLPVDCVRRVLLHLASACGGDPRVIRTAACVSKSWLRAADSPEVYVAMLRERYGVDDLSLPFTRDRVDWGEDNYLTTVPPVDPSDRFDFPVFRFYDAHDGSPDTSSVHPERHGLWTRDMIYDSTEDGLLHRLTPRNVAAIRARRAARAPDPRACFAEWHAEYGDLDPVKFRACKRAWDAVERSFLDADAEDIVDTIMPGISRRRCDEMAAYLDRIWDVPFSPLHPDLALLYRLRGGQMVFVDPSSGFDEDGVVYRAPDERELCTFPMGLFGGHFFYGQMPCVRFLPLDMFLFNCATAAAGSFAGLAVAAEVSGDGDGLVVYVDRHDGRPYVCDRGGLTFGPKIQNRLPAAPEGITVLGWFQEYARRVAAGVYAPRDVSHLHPRFGKMMWRIPRVTLGVAEEEGSRETRADAWSLASGSGFEPETTVYEATTRDVRIRVASAPHRRTGDPGHPTLHTYSVRMDILAEEEQRRRWRGDPERFEPMLRAQLKSRLWVIRAYARTDGEDPSGGEPTREDRVSGEGVIGEFPILEAGAPPFEYQSCVERWHDGESIEMSGGFTFVEGTLNRPAGDEFFAECPAFTLENANFYF